MTSEKCPVCEGIGKFWPYSPGQGFVSNTTAPPECHACHGRGWIVFDPTVYITQPVIQYDVHAT